MKKIKEFEAFNEGILDDIKKGIGNLFTRSSLENPVDNIKTRNPQKVSKREFDEKLESFGKVPFTKWEVNFFEKLKRKDYCKHWKFSMDLLSSGSIIIGIHKIIKLDDEWYLIRRYSTEYGQTCDDYYICDEFNEVIGYLESIFRRKID